MRTTKELSNSELRERIRTLSKGFTSKASIISIIEYEGELRRRGEKVLS